MEIEQTMSLLLIAAAALTVQDPRIEDVLPSTFKSATFTAVVGSAKQAELQKINKDFAQSYRFKRMDVMMKEPFMLHLASKVDDSEIVMVINGVKKAYKIPRAGISKTEDNSKSPGKRQTALDFGVLTPGLFDGYLASKYVRTDRRTGEYVFDLTYSPSFTDESRHRVWIDPKTKFLTKREWYSQKGFLRATFTYSDPVMMGGVAFPTKATVANADNILAGTMNYVDIKMNPSLADSLFKI